MKSDTVHRLCLCICLQFLADSSFAQEVDTLRIHPIETCQQFEEAEGIASLLEASKFIRAGKARSKFNVDGSGFTVAVLDSGLNTKHVDFTGGADVRAKVNFTSEGNPDDVTDYTGHGTNVSGIVCANGLHTGIAPEAKIVPLKVIKKNGQSDYEWMEKALAWVIKNHAQHKISVVNVSIGGNKNRTSDTFGAISIHAKIRKQVQQLKALHIPVVVSAGNSFFEHSSKQGMLFPAIVRETISVGAIFDTDIGKKSYSNGAVAEKTGPGLFTPFSHRLHPSFEMQPNETNPLRTDVFATGAPITSTGIKKTKGVSVMHGTSQAAPVACGVILLMQQFHKRAKNTMPSVDELESYLRMGPVINDGDDENDNVVNTKLDFIRIDAVDSLTAMREKIRLELMSDN